MAVQPPAVEEEKEKEIVCNVVETCMTAGGVNETIIILSQHTIVIRKAELCTKFLATKYARFPKQQIYLTLT